MKTLRRRTEGRSREKRGDGGRKATRALLLLSQNRLSAAGLAERLGVSVITAKRVVEALRRTGWEIRSIRAGNRAHYEVSLPESGEEIAKDPLLSTTIHRSASPRPTGKAEDADYDRD